MDLRSKAAQKWSKNERKWNWNDGIPGGRIWSKKGTAECCREKCYGRGSTEFPCEYYRERYL